MRKTTFGIIYAGEENMSLRELVNKRSMGALPVGGRYRVIDFVLSNMINSGIRNVGVIPRKNYHSMMDHLGSGKPWDLNRKNGGLFLIPPYDTDENVGSYKGMIDTLNGAASYFRRSPEKYCLISGSNAVYNDSYVELSEFHIANGADITMMYSVEPPIKGSGADQYPDIRLKTDESGRVVAMKNHGDPEGFDKIGMGIYYINKDLLLYLLEDAATRGKINFANDIIAGNLAGLKVCGYEHKGYVGRVRSVASYFKTNMDLLVPSVQSALFQNTARPIYTKIKDEAPTKYGDMAQVGTSLVGSGCIIEGEIENCVIFRDVKIGKGAIVKNSVIMQSSEVMSGAKLSGVILDKKVTVRPDSVLTGISEYPIIIPKGATV